MGSVRHMRNASSLICRRGRDSYTRAHELKTLAELFDVKKKILLNLNKTAAYKVRAAMRCAPNAQPGGRLSLFQGQNLQDRRVD